MRYNITTEVRNSRAAVNWSNFVELKYSVPKLTQIIHAMRKTNDMIYSKCLMKLMRDITLSIADFSSFISTRSLFSTSTLLISVCNINFTSPSTFDSSGLFTLSKLLCNHLHQCQSSLFRIIPKSYQPLFTKAVRYLQVSSNKLTI